VSNTPSAAEQNNAKGKQRETPNANTQTPQLDDPSPPAGLDSNDNRKLWEFLRARRKLKMKWDASPEVVDVHPSRGFQVRVSFTAFTLLF
jgi:hypothetical protein